MLADRAIVADRYRVRDDIRAQRRTSHIRAKAGRRHQESPGAPTPARHSTTLRPDTGELLDTTRTGRPIEPRNLARSFHRICAASGLRTIQVHHLRHTTATLLKTLGVPARDAQLILGHSRLAITLEIHSHEEKGARRQALTKPQRAGR